MNTETEQTLNPPLLSTVLVTGCTGFIGSRLVSHLKAKGYTVRGLSRHPQEEGIYEWNPSAGWMDLSALEDVEGVIHLAGESIASGRWNAKRKASILNSRVESTRCLVKAMAEMKVPPKAFVCSSGVNFYPFGDTVATESSKPGTGFLAEVCCAWEKEALRAEAFGIRTACVRTGIVLHPDGGVLGRLLPLYRIGLGGRVGSGKQGFPWIGMEDLLDIYEKALSVPDFKGPINAVHPQLIDQKTFNTTLAIVLKRPTLAPLPASVVRLFFGQMGEETLLANLWVKPDSLEQRYHRFFYRSLEEALRLYLDRPKEGN